MDTAPYWSFLVDGPIETLAVMVSSLEHLSSAVSVRGGEQHGPWPGLRIPGLIVGLTKSVTWTELLMCPPQTSLSLDPRYSLKT